MLSEEQIKAQDEYREFIKSSAPCSKSDVAKRVLAFMDQGNQPVLPFPGDPGADVRRLGASLILEEARETIEALGFRIGFNDAGKLDLINLADSQFSLKESTDGCIDTQYVCHWMLLAMGVSDFLPTLEVCDANDRKFGPGAHKDENGKVRKPPGWRGPDIEGALAAQMPRFEGDEDL